MTCWISCEMGRRKGAKWVRAGGVVRSLAGDKCNRWGTAAQLGLDAYVATNAGSIPIVPVRVSM